MENRVINLPAVTVGIAGRMKFEALKAVLDEDGNQVYDENGHALAYEDTRRLLADWMPNQILDNGRNVMSEISGSPHNGWLSSAQVGTDSTLPDAAQQQLFAYIAGTADATAQASAEASSPYYAWNRITYRFPAGPIGTQNLQEAGVGWNTASGAFLVSRALIVDAVGTPTPVVPAADELLDMTYEIRYYPPETPVVVTNAVTLNGVDYDVSLSTVNAPGARASSIGNSIGEFSPDSSYWAAYDGTSGGLADSTPNGASANCDNANQFNLTYQGNTYQIDMQCDCGPTGWNLGSFIRTIRFTTTVHDYQAEFSESADQPSPGDPIPKDANFTMQFVFRLGWTAATIP